MKKYLLISAFTLLAFTSCKKEGTTSEMDSEKINDSTTVVTEVEVDSTMSDSSKAKLLNQMETVTTTTVTDPADGKFTLSENTWILTELNGKAVDNKTGKEYFINLDSKSGNFTGFAGCNNLKGSYVMTKPGKLSLTKIISTKMACDAMKTESEFTAALTKTDNYMVEGDMLHLHKGKTAVAKFTIKK